ncbi:TPA: hypothetical protein PXM11_004265 [Yersinia enterocolitica]|nr:hypothetical protein [Yersinia enterocolitica]
MNNIEELKSKKPENLKSRSSVSADYVTDDNTGGYFVVECGNCGEVFPSQKLDGGGAIADSGDYGDAYCPHCNETDPDECANVGLVWNVQQAKINALIAQLEAAQKEISELKEEEQEWLSLADMHEHLNHQNNLNVEHRNKIHDLKEKLLAAEAALSAANEKLKGEQVPDGFAMVPAKANIAMIRAGGKAAREYMEEYGGNSPQVIYQAMVAAALLPAGFTVEGE